MFTWICPKCGREVPPAYDECPNCAKQASDAAQQPLPAAMPPPQQQPPPAPAEYQPRFEPRYEQRHEPPPQPPPPPIPPYTYAAPPRPRSGMPTWLLTIVFAFAFLGLGVGTYWLIGYIRGNNLSKPTTTVESPAARPGTRTNPLQKYIEISGVRFRENAKKKNEVRFVIVNHSGGEIDGLTGNVTVWGRTQKSEELAAGTFTFTTNLAPFESKELTAVLNTNLKIYELPDWQNVSTDIQITAPSASGGSPAPQ